jgi:hypothetical protein
LALVIRSLKDGEAGLAKEQKQRQAEKLFLKDDLHLLIIEGTQSSFPARVLEDA